MKEIHFTVTLLYILVAEMTETNSKVIPSPVSENISVCRILILSGVSVLRK